MPTLKRYRRREMTTVIAVQIALDTEGFSYKKWGDVQVARAGDWLVNNNGNAYTIDREIFEKTYSQVSDGVYEKTGLVWAERAQKAGKVRSTSGFTNYHAGDFVVFNDEDRTDGWAMREEEFKRLYELNEDSDV
ncbi:hypothetical protein TRP8649_03641 [Pelagimonas phthalicica]|uniref:Uncharacterized protein n=2 Tax=Pelagimonas phthalicica TaxID=1037362 RepID=A0A238JGF6_9RHOB|nr:hypothetical protein CLV87_3638 [Pelagimonas phthalicica]SMX29505.1 hypothetical protein TRP8649_03641 [Pelagimonas phthalicica]